MDKAFWTAREQAALALASGAPTMHARQIHLELARRYGVEAARCDRPSDGPETDDGGRRVEVSMPMPSRPASLFRPLDTGLSLPVEPED